MGKWGQMLWPHNFTLSIERACEEASRGNDTKGQSKERKEEQLGHLSFDTILPNHELWCWRNHSCGCFLTALSTQVINLRCHFLPIIVLLPLFLRNLRESKREIKMARYGLLPSMKPCDCLFPNQEGLNVPSPNLSSLPSKAKTYGIHNICWMVP